MTASTPVPEDPSQRLRMALRDYRGFGRQDLAADQLVLASVVDEIGDDLYAAAIDCYGDAPPAPPVVPDDPTAESVADYVSTHNSFDELSKREAMVEAVRVYATESARQSDPAGPAVDPSVDWEQMATWENDTADDLRAKVEAELGRASFKYRYLRDPYDDGQADAFGQVLDLIDAAAAPSEAPEPARLAPPQSTRVPRPLPADEERCTTVMVGLVCGFTAVAPCHHDPTHPFFHPFVPPVAPEDGR